MAGLIAGRYRLEEQVGLGGMGLVWRATDLELGRTVALKRSQDTGSGGGRALRREARIAAVLQHQHVVTLYDVVTDGEQRWLVMEYVPWRSLAQLIADTGPVGPRRAAALGAQLADALDSLHAKGIVHADVKPGNVLIGPDDAVKLIDFGLSRPVAASRRSGAAAAARTVAGAAGPGDPGWSATDAGVVRGTPGYQAPEVAAGGPATAAADLFSLGATVFAAVAGHSPYGSAAHPAALHRRALAAGAGTPSRLPRPRTGADSGAPGGGTVAPAHPAVPATGDLAPVLAALLAANPADRPDAARARRLLTAAAPGARPMRRHRVAAVGAAVALLVALTGGTAGDAARPVPAPSLGVAADADPCALLDPRPLRRYGSVDVESAYGNFNRCDAIVHRRPGPDLDVQVEFGVGSVSRPRGAIGGVSVWRGTQHDGACGREFPMPGGYRISVLASLDEDGSADLCPVAETAAASAANVLRRGTVPRRRPFPAGSLGGVDGCALLRGAPGVVGPIDRGFAGWECSAGGAEDTSLRWRFDRNEPLTASDGRPVRLAGRSAFVTADGDGDGTCLVQVVQRRFADSHGAPTEELMYLVVQGDGAGAGHCPLARRLAGAAARRLPPP